jgi:hypothetical protein
VGKPREKLAALADLEARRTHRLRLNIVPTRVWRRDAFVAFRKTIEVFAKLKAIDPTALDLESNVLPHEFAEQEFSIPEIARMLEIPDDPHDPEAAA